MVDGIEELSLRIPANQLVRILLVEDEEGNATSLKEVLEHHGYSVQVASNPADARVCLEAMEFEILISDQVFEGSDTEGDSFLLDRPLYGTSKVLVTGKGREGIRRIDELEQRGIPILEKGDHGFHPQLKEIAARALDAAKKRIMESVNSPRSGHNEGGSRALLEARELLLDWLRKFQDSSDQTIFYGGKSYSSTDLIAEIEAGTPVGEEHVVMFVKVIRKAMRL